MLKPINSPFKAPEKERSLLPNLKKREEEDWGVTGFPLLFGIFTSR
jgi:hypothetical protein